jgi:two-component system sensor histidine kinase DegS
VDFQVGAIDKVIKNAIEVMENSKYQIFEIYEAARLEFENLEKELVEILGEISGTIDRVDRLEVEYKKARVRLTEVSRDFKRFKEIDIKVAYEHATNIQMELSLQRERESQLRARRDDMKKRIRNIERSMERAEVISSQMNVVLEYLSGDLNQVTRILESAKNRQLLGLKITLAQEEERKRIAREIHDGPAQSMANIVLRTEIAERMIAKQEFDMVRVELGDLKTQVRSGLEEIRKIMFNLRPMALDDLGLIPTLRKYIQDFEEKSKLRTKFELIGKEVRLPSAMEVAIYRLIQEAFTNSQKHANASFLSVEITYQLHMVKISIQDNGRGFNLEKFQSSVTTGTQYGLIGMRERVELLEGRMDIQSEPDAGTKITMLIPINVDNRKE